MINCANGQPIQHGKLCENYREISSSPLMNSQTGTESEHWPGPVIDGSSVSRHIYSTPHAACSMQCGEGEDHCLCIY